jgi:hypothetical protein
MKKSIANFVHLITSKNVWNVVNWAIDIIGILFVIWIVLSLLYPGVVLLSGLATTYFSDSNSWAQLSYSFFKLSVVEILAVIALAISGINSIVKYLNIKDLEVDVHNSEVDITELKEELKMKTLELNALKESKGK